LNLDGSVPSEFYNEDYWEHGDASGRGSYNGNAYDDNVAACGAWALDMYIRWGPFKRVLELGCGRGWNIYGFLNMSDLDVTAFGIDISHYAVETAHDSVKPFLIEGDICNILATREDSSWDLVFSNDVLEHLTLVQLEKCLYECRRVAKQRVVNLVSIGKDVDLPFGTAPLDQDQSHVTMKSKAWWQELFSEMFVRQVGHGQWTSHVIAHGSTVEFDMRRVK